MKKLFEKLFIAEDNSPLIIFRVMFGFLLFIHFLTSLTSGLVFDNYIKPPFIFPYIGFEFLRSLQGTGMYFLFGALALLSLFVMAGAWYRISIILLTIGWLVIYLMQKVGYNNHYYLMLLLCIIMCFMPAGKRFGIDARKSAVEQENQIYAWQRYVFLFQIAIVYFFAATSKLNPDWFSGRFMTIQLSRWSQHPRLGWIYGQEWFPKFISFSGFALDLFLIPLLLWRRTRVPAFILATGFHLFNAFTFRIGIFPFLSIALLIFFFEPGRVAKIFLRKGPIQQSLYSNRTYPYRTSIVYALLLYALVQIALPLRYLLYPGNVFWNEEGYRLSWKMMLRTKSGNIHFKVQMPGSGEFLMHYPAERFSPTHVMWLAGSPDMIWQYAQKLKEEYRAAGNENIELYAVSLVSLNRRPYFPLVDSTINLAKIKWQVFRHSSWITDSH